MGKALTIIYSVFVSKSDQVYPLLLLIVPSGVFIGVSYFRKKKCRLKCGIVTDWDHPTAVPWVANPLEMF